MATYYPSSIFPIQFVNPDNGVLASGFTVSAYLAGTTTPTPMYTDKNGTSAGTSVTLNAAGRPEVSGSVITIWLQQGVEYKFILEDEDSNTEWTIDEIIGYLSGTSGIYAPVDDYATFRTNMTNGEYVVGGNVRVTDPPGPPFEIKQGSATDDGGVIITENGGSVSGSQYYAERVYTGPVDIEWFEAKTSNTASQNNTPLQNAIDNHDKIHIAEGDFSFSSLSISGNKTFSGDGRLVGSAVSGSKPTRATLISDGSKSARLTSLQTYYTGQINLTGSVSIKGVASFKDCLIYSSSLGFSSYGNVTLDNVGFHDTGCNAERNGVIQGTNSLICSDSPSSSFFVQTGGEITAQSSIIVYAGSRGAQAYRSGSIDISLSEIYYSSSAGIYTLMGGCIVATSATISNSGLSGVLINYGGIVDVSSGTVTASSQSGIACESNGVVFADSTNVTNNTLSGMFVTFNGTIQATSATVTGNGTYGLYARDVGTIYANLATVDNTNTGVSGQIIRAIGVGYIYAQEPGTAGFSTLSESNYFPGFNRASSSGGYIGTNTADDAKQSLYSLIGPTSPPSAVIASGAAIPLSSFATVDTEGAAATDDLDDIDPTYTHVWYVRTASSVRDVTLKHNTGGATNPIILNTGADKTLGTTDEMVVLIYNPSTGNWIEPK